MPRTLSRDELTTLKQSLINQAPTGLSSDEFARWMGPRLDGAIAEAENSQNPVSGSALRHLIAGAVSALPTVGGMVGSLAGSAAGKVGAVAGATLGGAAGNGFRALAEHAADVPAAVADVASAVRQGYGREVASGAAQGAVEGATSAAKDAAVQGGSEAAGQYVVGPALRSAGRGLYRSVLKPGTAINLEFAAVGAPLTGSREVTRALVDAGVPITRTGAGTEKAMALLKRAGQETADAIASAPQRDVTLRPVLQSLDATRQAVSDRAVRSPALDEIQRFRNAVLSENGPAISLPRAQAMKSAEQDLALKAYQAAARGAPTNAVETSLHEDLARGLREAIERRVPGIWARNQATRQLIGAVKAISQAEGRVANRDMIGMGDALAAATAAGGHAAMGPAGLAAGVLQEVLTRPELASRLGILLDRAGTPIAGASIPAQAIRSIAAAAKSLEHP